MFLTGWVGAAEGVASEVHKCSTAQCDLEKILRVTHAHIVVVVQLQVVHRRQVHRRQRQPVVANVCDAQAGRAVPTGIALSTRIEELNWQGAVEAIERHVEDLELG